MVVALRSATPAVLSTLRERCGLGHGSETRTADRYSFICRRPLKVCWLHVSSPNEHRPAEPPKTIPNPKKFQPAHITNLYVKPANHRISKLKHDHHHCCPLPRKSASKSPGLENSSAYECSNTPISIFLGRPTNNSRLLSLCYRHYTIYPYLMDCSD